MLKSVLLSSLLILITIYSLSLFAAKEEGKVVIASDQLRMKVGSDVYFLQDLKNTYALFQDYSCMNEDSSLVNSLFLSSKSLEAQSRSSFFRKSFDKENKDQSDFILMFYKISKFIDRQTVRVNPELSKLLAESSQANKCGAGNKPEAIAGRFALFLELDTFFSSRFSLEESQKNQNSSIKSFLDSIDKQIKHEIY